MYVAAPNTSNDRIEKFTSTGTFLTTWGSLGTGNGRFVQPEGVATDSSGHVYVTEVGNSRVQKFTSSGGFLTKWGSFGSGDGQFNNPHGVAVDGAGNVYVATRQTTGFEKFTSSGQFLAKWGSFGSGAGQFNDPIDLATDATGHVYVADDQNDRIVKYAQIPPKTTITGANVNSAERKARFRFKSSEAGSTFNCKRDHRRFAPCSSPMTFKHLRVGKHTFEVKATDKDKLTDQTPARKGFRIR